MLKLAVFGNPIKQSQSPAIHALFAQQFDLSIHYTAQLIESGEFDARLAQFFTDPAVKGCNVTAPFKQQAAKWAAQLSPVAEVTGAVNTLIREDDGQIKGDNTDGGGLVNDIKRQGITIANSRILLLGAGGAARGVLPDLLHEQPHTIKVVNRTPDKALELVKIGQSLNQDCQFEALAYADVGEQPFDIIINATSLSLNQQLPPLAQTLFTGVSLVYDMVYQDQPTPFLQWASENGAINVRDGLGMLVGQAALSFAMWTGFQPQIEPVIAALRQNAK